MPSVKRSTSLPHTGAPSGRRQRRATTHRRALREAQRIATEHGPALREAQRIAAAHGPVLRQTAQFIADFAPAIMEAERIVAEHRPSRTHEDLPRWVAEAPEPVFRAWLEGEL